MKLHQPIYTVFFLAIASVICLTLSSCDPGQAIIIKNESGGNAQMTLVLKPGPKSYMFEEFSESDTIHIALDTTAANSQKHYDFGIGHWEVMGAMDSLVATVKQIDIQTPSTNKSYSTPQEIKAFFEERIKGRMKEQIVVVLE